MPTKDRNKDMLNMAQTAKSQGMGVETCHFICHGSFSREFNEARSQRVLVIALRAVQVSLTKHGQIGILHMPGCLHILYLLTFYPVAFADEIFRRRNCEDLQMQQEITRTTRSDGL